MKQEERYADWRKRAQLDAPTPVKRTAREKNKHRIKEIDEWRARIGFKVK